MPGSSLKWHEYFSMWTEKDGEAGNVLMIWPAGMIRKVDAENERTSTPDPNLSQVS